MPGDINVWGVPSLLLGSAVLGFWGWCVGWRHWWSGVWAQWLPSVFAACLVIIFINSLGCCGAFSVLAHGKTKIDAEVSPVSTRKYYHGSWSK